MTLERVRNDLKEIRHYFKYKKQLDNAFGQNMTNDVLGKVSRYNDAMNLAPIFLFQMYFFLYTQNLTQEALAQELGYTPEYIQRLNKKLTLFLFEQLNKG